jgi:hypothetical protein
MLEKAAKVTAYVLKFVKELKNALGKGNTNTDKTTKALTLIEN